MLRNDYIERVLRQIYGGYIPDDSEITRGLVNNILGDAIALAAKMNYTDSIKIDGIGYVNNSFYTTFKSIAITKDENFLYKLTLPHIPFGVGRNEGISNLRVKDDKNNVSLDCIPLSINQKGYVATMKPIPNKTLYYSEGNSIFILSTLLLYQYTASVTLISGGDSTDLNSELNVPSDYLPIMQEYIIKQLAFEQSRVRDLENNGADLGDKK